MAKHLMITARPEQGFRRLARHFGTTPTYVPLTDLTEDQIQTLKSEPQLVVVEADPPPVKDAAKPAAAK